LSYDSVSDLRVNRELGQIVRVPKGISLSLTGKFNFAAALA